MMAFPRKIVDPIDRRPHGTEAPRSGAPSRHLPMRLVVARRLSAILRCVISTISA